MHPKKRNPSYYKKSNGKYQKGLRKIQENPSQRRKKAGHKQPNCLEKKLSDDTITPSLVKRMKTNLLIKEIPSDANDCLTRIKFGRTMYGQQGVNAGISDDPWCSLCLEISNLEVDDSFEHHNYSCPHVLPIIKEVTNYFLGYTPTCKNYIMGITCSPLGLSIKKELGLKISSLVCNQTVHLITTKRRAKQVLIGTSLIVQIISQLKQLSLILPDTNLTGIISSPLFKHFTILTNSKLYSEPTIQDQDG